MGIQSVEIESMGIGACRELCRHNKTSGAAHAGLMLANQLRFTGDKGKEKGKLLGHAMDALKKSHGIYAAAWDRWTAATAGAEFQEITMNVAQRLVVGLGAKGVLETGLRLHYTYGTPLIPGSALKGLAAHYCHSVLGGANAEFQSTGEFPAEDGRVIRRAGIYYGMLFGTNEGSGLIRFHDAWIEPNSIQAGEGLLLDVMTTHHQKYYNGSEAPHDAEDPIPIQFLSTRGAFRFVLEVDDSGADAKRWLEYTMDLLKQALASWGAGGKTSSGYGRFTA